MFNKKLFISLLMTVSIIFGAVGFGGCNDTTVTVNFVTYCQEEIPPTEYEIDNYYRKLPTPTRDGYEFLGWFSEEVGGELIKGNNKASRNTKTLYARWVANNTRIAATSNVALILDDNGTLWGWGKNMYGQLGDGTTEDRLTPAKIMPNIKFSQIYANGISVFAIDVNGNLWAWGTNTSAGLLGDGTTEDRLTPVKVMQGTKFKKIMAGGHALAIDEDGNLWAWGNNSYGKVGNGKSSTLTENNDVLTPTKIMPGTKFKDVAVGGWHSVAIDNNGKLWVWGASTHGQLGDGVVSNNLLGTPIPKQIMLNTNFRKVYSEGDYTYAIDEEDNLWTWGWNVGGRLGNGTETDIYTPVKIITNTKFLACGGHTIIIDSSATLWSWGTNLFGQLGDGSTNKQLVPIPVLETMSFANVDVAYGYTIAMDQKGNFWSWGYYESGNLGDGVTQNSLVPFKIILE